MKKKEESMDKAMEALKNHNYAVAKKIFEDRVQQDDLVAICNLGIMYLNGHGVNADINKAKGFFLTASGGGSVEANYYLGMIYAADSKAEPFQARVCFLKAAAAGHKGAQFSLGMLLINERTFLKGMDWLEKAASEPGGHPAAQCALGKIYEEGRGNRGPKNENKAREYFLAAANKGDKEAQYCLGLMYTQGRGGNVNEVEAMGWFAKAAKQGHKKAESCLFVYANSYGIGIENRSQEVPRLIESVQQILGDDYRKDLHNMFDGLWHKGIPSLKGEPFYHHQYKICFSLECIPETKEVGTVYLYVEKGKLRYQVVTRLGLCDGSLDVAEGFNLALLKEVSFSPVPPSENRREIYYNYNGRKTKCIYEVIDDKGERQVGKIRVNPESTEKEIKQNLLKKITGKYCSENKAHLQSLRNDLQQQLIQNGHLEPSYEDRFPGKIERAYAEIVAEELKISRFFQELIAILEHDEFIAIFESREKFIKLRSQYISIIKELSNDQEKIIAPFKEAVFSSEGMIDVLKSAYAGKINHKNYYDMVIFIQLLHEMIDNKEAIIEKIESFCEKYPHLLSSKEIQNLPVIFTAQFATRRILLFQNLAGFFRKGHDKFYQLELVFFALEQLATIANKAQPKGGAVTTDEKDNLQMMSQIQSNLERENNKLKVKCFELIKPIFTLLTLEMNQVDLVIILQTYPGAKRKLIDCLLDLKTWFQDLQLFSLVEKIEKAEKGIHEKDDLDHIIVCVMDLIASIDILFPKESLKVKNSNESVGDREHNPVPAIKFSDPQHGRRSSRVGNFLDKLSLSPRQKLASPSQRTREEPSIQGNKGDSDMLVVNDRGLSKRSNSPLSSLEDVGLSLPSAHDVESPLFLALDDNLKKDTSLSQSYDGIARSRSPSKNLMNEDRVFSLPLVDNIPATREPSDKKKEPCSEAPRSRPRNSSTPLSNFFDSARERSSLSSSRNSPVIASSLAGGDKVNKGDEEKTKKSGDRPKFKISPRLHRSKRSSKQDESPRCTSLLTPK